MTLADAAGVADGVVAGNACTAAETSGWSCMLSLLRGCKAKMACQLDASCGTSFLDDNLPSVHYLAAAVQLYKCIALLAKPLLVCNMLTPLESLKLSCGIS